MVGMVVAVACTAKGNIAAMGIEAGKALLCIGTGVAKRHGQVGSRHYIGRGYETEKKENIIMNIKRQRQRLV